MLDIAQSRPESASPQGAAGTYRHLRDTPSAASVEVAPAAPIFIGGAGRSGTTLLRVILDSHSRIACGPELKVIPSIATLWADFHSRWAPVLADSRVEGGDIDRLFAGLIVNLLEPMRRAAGKPRVAEKSPNNVYFFPHLHRMFPDASFLHVLRDGRDVVASLLTMQWTTTDGTPVDYTRDARLAARYWADAVRVGRAFASATAGHSHYREVRYEDILADPESTLRDLFAFLGEPWEPAVLAYHEVARPLGDESSATQVAQPLTRASAGRWRRDLSAADRQAVKEEVGDLLIELGYARDYAW